MVSENESEFTNPKSEFTDSKSSLNKFDIGGRISSQNFLIIFQNFKIFNIFMTLKIEKMAM